MHGCNQWRCEAGASQGRLPQLERALLWWTKWAKINQINSKIKLLKSPENNFDIDVFINPKYNIKSQYQCDYVMTQYFLLSL